MTSKTLYILLFSLLFVPVYAQQQFNGTVIDKATSQAIPLAKIIIEYRDTLQETETNFEGEFNFRIVQTDSLNLKISALDYQNLDSVIFINSELLDLIIELSPDTTRKYRTVHMSQYNKQGALSDIKKGKIQLLLPGGIIPAPRLFTDKDFENKFNLKFISQGCVRYPGENQTEYNQEVFKYLDEKYGDIWRKEIRNDVIGLNAK